MKSAIIPALALAVCCSTSVSFAQESKGKSSTKEISEETVVIKRNGEGKTIIEIKDGNVYVNGDNIATVKDIQNNHTRKKIIIDNGNDADITMPFSDRQENIVITRKAMLGVYTKPDNADGGAEIERVMPNSAAAEAGLKTGDVITSIDGKAINNGKELTEIIADKEAGEKVTISYKRNGKVQNATAALSKAPGISIPRGRHFNPFEGNGDIPNTMIRPFSFDINDAPFEPSPKMGVTVEDMNNGDGVKVLDVKPSSPAAEAGIRKNDILKKLDNESISSVQELQDILGGTKKNQPLKLQYEREGNTNTTNIVFPKSLKKKDL